MSKEVIGRIEVWYEYFGADASVTSFPALVDDYLFETEEEKDRDIYLVVDRDLPGVFSHNVNDIIIKYISEKKHLTIIWKGVIWEKQNADHEVDQQNLESENQPPDDDDMEGYRGEFGFGGDWWKGE